MKLGSMAGQTKEQSQLIGFPWVHSKRCRLCHFAYNHHHQLFNNGTLGNQGTLNYIENTAWYVKTLSKVTFDIWEGKFSKNGRLFWDQF